MRQRIPVVSLALITLAFGVPSYWASGIARVQAAVQSRASSESEIRALMARIDSARASHDPSAVETVYADDFYIVHTNGTVRRRADWLETFRAASFRAEREQMRWFDYGDVALVLAVVHVTGTLADGRPVDKREQVTYVWVRRDARWQLAAMHGTSAPGPARAGSVEEEVRQAEEARREAILHNDTTTLDRLLADSLVTTLDAGDVRTKADELAVNRPSDRKLESWEATDVAVRFYGDSAVVTGRAAVKDSLRDEGVRSFSFRFTHVWAKIGGRWQLVARHMSGRIPPRSRSKEGS